MSKIIYIFFLWLLLLPLSMRAEKSSSDVAVASVETDSRLKKTTISVYENVLYVSHAPENARVEVKNMLGENVLVEKVKQPQQKFELNLKKGFYIVRVEDVLQRIVIK